MFSNFTSYFTITIVFQHFQILASLLTNPAPSTSNCDEPPTQTKKKGKRKIAPSATVSCSETPSIDVDVFSSPTQQVVSPILTSPVTQPKPVQQSVTPCNMPCGYSGFYECDTLQAGKQRILNTFASPNRTVLDHAYSTGDKRPKKKMLKYDAKPLGVSDPQLDSNENNEIMEFELLSDIESIYDDIADDPDYQPTGESEHETDCEIDNSPVDVLHEQKFIVFQTNLEALMKFCQSCGSPVTHFEKLTQNEGSAVTYKIYCHKGCTYTWHSQPSIGNTMVSASILITGNTFTKVSAFAKAMNLKFIAASTYDVHQKDTLIPVINQAWKEETTKVNEQMNEKETLILAGDARCDSVGHNAKFGAYTLMDADTTQGKKKIVCLNLVQVSEVKNSNHMEIEGLRRCLKELKDANLKLSTLATDRHLMIGAMMKKDFKEINHQFDIWHLVKSLLKKLWPKAKTDKCSDLTAWIQSIANHLWWAAATCGGNAQVLKEKWLSLLQHITNRHSWGGNQHFHKCAHDKLTLQQKRSTKWLNPKSEAFKALQSIVTGTRFLNALPQITMFCHTGELEVFHSMLLKYCPKRQHFHYEAMTARLYLAALDWNSQTRGVKFDDDGDAIETIIWSKRRKMWVKRLMYTRTSENHVEPLMAKVVNARMENIPLTPIERPENIPKHVSAVPKPEPGELTRKSRFGIQ